MIDNLRSRSQIPQKTLTKMPIIATLYRSMMKLDLFVMKLDSLTFVFCCSFSHLSSEESL